MNVDPDTGTEMDMNMDKEIARSWILIWTRTMDTDKLAKLVIS
jgi:hypothetical protein